MQELELYREKGMYMRALVLEGDKKIELKQIENPQAEESRSLLVRVKYSGICGSDIPRGFHGKAYHYPLVMGHEFSGVLEEAPGESQFSAGDRVAVFPLLPCGRCTACQTGDYAQCTDYDYYGSRRDGGFAEYVRVPEKNLFAIPDHVDLLSASMTEPCAVAYHGVEKLQTRAGMRGLVIGGGPIGNMTAQWLKLKGLDPVYLADVDHRKLSIAEEMGMIPIDSTKASPLEQMNNPADCVVEACGLPATFVQAIESAARFGQVVFMGNIHGTFSLEEQRFSSILRNELTIRGTWNSKVTPLGSDDWSRTLHFLNKGIEVKPLISHTPSLEEGAEIFRMMVEKTDWYNKVVFAL